jgi:hypothetical protein
MNFIISAAITCIIYLLLELYLRNTTGDHVPTGSEGIISIWSIFIVVFITTLFYTNCSMRIQFTDWIRIVPRRIRLVV